MKYKVTGYNLWGYGWFLQTWSHIACITYESYAIAQGELLSFSNTGVIIESLVWAVWK